VSIIVITKCNVGVLNCSALVNYNDYVSVV